MWIIQADVREIKMKEPLLLRPSEAAQLLGICRTKTYQLIAAGDLPSVRIGGSVRVPVAALHDWISKRMRDGA